MVGVIIEVVSLLLFYSWLPESGLESVVYVAIVLFINVLHVQQVVAVDFLNDAVCLAHLHKIWWLGFLIF